jgi:hypothetical protein
LSSVLLEANLRKEDAAPEPLPGSVLARFLELRGRRIVNACGALWYTVPGRFLMSVPYQTMLNPDPDELRRMIRETRTCGARFPSLSWTGLPSGLYVLRRRAYDIGSLHSKHRPRVRHGMQQFEVRPAQKAELLEQGCALNLSTMARQGRYDAEFGEPKRWGRFVEAAFACPGVSFPAAFAGSRLAAYMVTCREQHWLHILHQLSRQEDLPHFPNHFLPYTLTAPARRATSLEAVCYGYVPLFAADGLHEYKLRFGYEMVPHCSAIQLHPALKRVLDRPLAHAAVSVLRSLRRNDQHLETIETVLKGARSSRRG